MADKSVGELIAAQSVTPTDLFVLEQNGTAKKLTGQILENWLVSFADGHGGIQSIAKLSTSGLVDTYRITLADTTTFDFAVTNGRSITGISKTSTSGLVDTYTIRYNNGTTTSTFTVKNGEKGDKGDNAYVWIKYASQEPTESSHSIGDIPDDWIGIYSGNASTAPTDWKQYKWFKHKGEKGDTGSPATLATKSVTYQVGDSGTIIPSGTWVNSVPVASQGKYLWTKTEVRFNTGDPVISYSVARMGVDGSGSVSSVAGVSPDATGNVTLTAADVGALAVSGGEMTGPINMNGQSLSGLNAPTKDTEPATKRYVDDGFLHSDWLPTLEEIGAMGAIESTDQPGCYYRTVNGVVEWLNPPMVLGVEYRTTERWMGKAVYAKLVNFGALPNATVASCEHGASATYIVRCTGAMSNGSSLPYYYGSNYIELSATKSKIHINSNYDYSSAVGYVTLFYVKD